MSPSLSTLDVNPSESVSADWDGRSGRTKKRWSAQEKLAIVAETYQSGMPVSVVARIHGVHPNQLSGWRRMHREGTLHAGSGAAPNSDALDLVAAQRRIQELERMLGAKTLEAELLQRALAAKQRTDP